MLKFKRTQLLHGVVHRIAIRDLKQGRLEPLRKTTGSENVAKHATAHASAIVHIKLSHAENSKTPSLPLWPNVETV